MYHIYENTHINRKEHSSAEEHLFPFDSNHSHDAGRDR